MADVMMSMHCCPYLHPLRILGRKWSYPILRHLQAQRTFSELKSDLRHITSRTLSVELRMLTKFGLVEKKDDLYLLSASGYSLLGAVRILGQWGVQQGCRSCPNTRDCATCDAYRHALNSGCLRPQPPSGGRAAATPGSWR